MFPIKTLLCPTDFSEPSREALKISLEFASHFRCDLWLVNVIPILPVVPPLASFSFAVTEYEQTLLADADDKLRQLTKQTPNAGASIQTIVGRGDPAGEILRIAQQQKADMIIIATHGMTGWRRTIFGSVAERVVRLATTPVLTTRAPELETITSA
jgi:nucleotide-binding universal stress UspA family protein